MKKIFAFIFCIVFNLTSFAQQNTCPFVWKLEKRNEPISYLVGTIHFNVKEKELSDCLKEIINNSELLLTETYFITSPDELAETDFVSVAQIQVNAKNPNQLKDELGEQLYEELKNEVLNSELVSLLPMFDYFYAWSILMNFSAVPANSNLSPQFGVDFLLSKYAKEKGINRLGLETAMEQVLLFKKLPQSRIIQLLEISLHNKQKLAEDEMKLLATYNNGDIEKMTNLVLGEEAFIFFPKQDKLFWQEWFIKDLLYDRTNAWLVKILPHLREKKVVIAVGVGHILGDNGLIVLLQDKGYKVSLL